ncbi:hypothetical protein MHU86_4684 [Fragilaria crotonensis]|nr:hypothetical protein MHU86_4684 [Fragilaria crotonensis]
MTTPTQTAQVLTMNPQNHVLQCVDEQDVPNTTWDQFTCIMIGKGPTCFNNAGNVLFRKFIKGKVRRYQKAVLRGKKTSMVKSLASELHEKGCRFLLRSFTGTWVQASSRLIERKVNHALRDALHDADTAVSGRDIDTPPSDFRPPCTEDKPSTPNTHQTRPLQRLTMYDCQSLVLHDHDAVSSQLSDIDYYKSTDRQGRYSSVVDPTTRQVDDLTSVAEQDEHVVAALGIILGIYQQVDEC